MENFWRGAPFRLWLWGGLAVVWLSFWFWYTNTEGALSQEEIAAFTALMEQQGSPAEQQQRLRRFMEQDQGDQFLMVNLLQLAEPQPGAAPSQELLDRYMDHMYPELFKRASHPLFAGPVVFDAMDLAGIEGAETWGSVAIVRYRSRRDLLEIGLNPIFADKHGFKLAALEKTIAVPVEPLLHLSDLRLLLLLALTLLGNCITAVHRRLTAKPPLAGSSP